MIIIRVTRYTKVVAVEGFSKCRKALKLLDEENINHICKPGNPSIFHEFYNTETVYEIKVPYDKIGIAETIMFASNINFP